MKYDIWGIRFDDIEFRIGEEIPKSHSWDMGTETDEELPGTCAIGVSDESDFLDYLDGKLEVDEELDRYKEALKANYDGKHIYLVGIKTEWGWEYGEDENEIVMNGAEVVRKIR